MRANPYLMGLIEASYGVDAGVAGANAIRTKSLSVTPYDGNRGERKFDGDGGIDRPFVHQNAHTTFGFGVEAAGSGAAATPANYGALLRACGAAETIGVDNVAYTRETNPANHDSISILVEEDEAQYYKALGVRGKVGLSLDNGVPTLNFSDLKGSYIQPAAVGAAETWVVANQQLGIPISSGNTTTLTLGGDAICVRDLSIANLFGMNVERLDLVNCNNTKLINTPADGSLTVDAPDIATKNYWDEQESHQTVTKQVFAMVHGTAAGNIILLDCTEVQISNVRRTGSDGQTLQYSMDLRFLKPITFTTK